jgi:hypothetical protein
MPKFIKWFPKNAGSLKMLYNKGNQAKLKYVQLQPSPSRVKMVAKFIRRGIRVASYSGSSKPAKCNAPVVGKYDLGRNRERIGDGCEYSNIRSS